LIRGILPPTDNQWENKMRASIKLIRVAMLSTCLAAPMLHAADNCSGFYGNELVNSDTVEVANGGKITFFSDHGSVSSSDSAYNGLGGCAGFVYAQADGKGWVSGSCTRVAANGDNWSYTFFEDLADGGKGLWKAVKGTGQFAKNVSNNGWYQNTGSAGKMSTGKWGGTCAK
jgi:hypothetical protein